MINNITLSNRKHAHFILQASLNCLIAGDVKCQYGLTLPVTKEPPYMDSASYVLQKDNIKMQLKW